MTELAAGIVSLLGSYVLVGFVFAFLFVLRGLHAVDPTAKSAPATFRLAIFPGTAALWPLLLAKWVRARN